jgi:hypothetical protein
MLRPITARIGRFAFGGTVMRRDVQLRSQSKSLPQGLPNSGVSPPQNQSHTLRSVVRSARVLIVAPLVTGASQASAFISLGQYSSALKCAATSGVATIILISALLLADLLIDFMERRRAARE